MQQMFKPRTISLAKREHFFPLKIPVTITKVDRACQTRLPYGSLTSIQYPIARPSSPKDVQKKQRIAGSPPGRGQSGKTSTSSRKLTTSLSLADIIKQ